LANPGSGARQADRRSVAIVIARSADSRPSSSAVALTAMPDGWPPLVFDAHADVGRVEWPAYVGDEALDVGRIEVERRR
jgi:hypothetical protein